MCYWALFTSGRKRLYKGKFTVLERLVHTAKFKTFHLAKKRIFGFKFSSPQPRVLSPLPILAMPQDNGITRTTVHKGQ